MGSNSNHFETREQPEWSTQRLADMFHTNMHLSNGVSGDASNNLPGNMTKKPEAETLVKYSISQHYTHSAHVVAALHPLQPSAQDLASRVLITNNISPSSLLRSQFRLFEEADDAQRSRLIELWQIVPPTYARNGGQELADNLGEYQRTSIAQEEELAWLRYQRDLHKGDVRMDVRVEQVCGRKSILGDYYGPSYVENLQSAPNQHPGVIPNHTVKRDGQCSEHPKPQLQGQSQVTANDDDREDVEML